MSARDRIVVIVLAAVAILAGGYLAVVSPERKKAAQVEAKVAKARSELSSAEAKLAEAKTAQSKFAAAYASIVRLGEAVPADQQVATLIYELDHASGHAKVQFQSITSSGESSSATPAAATSEAAAAAPAFRSMPFTFTFNGSFFDLYHLMQKIQGFTVASRHGRLQVNGRLLTIQSLSLSGGGSSSSESGGSNQLTGTVSATAYVLPPGEGLTVGATPAAPAGAQPASSPSSSGGGSPAAPAVIKAEP